MDTHKNMYVREQLYVLFVGVLCFVFICFLMYYYIFFITCCWFLILFIYFFKKIWGGVGVGLGGKSVFTFDL